MLVATQFILLHLSLCRLRMCVPCLEDDPMKTEGDSILTFSPENGKSSNFKAKNPPPPKKIYIIENMCTMFKEDTIKTVRVDGV